ncbi:MAG: hypothetical protein MI974_32230 [Chitinophagales bacterium]|nr:hypothetical protein [Chitinophagales bacterium]
MKNLLFILALFVANVLLANERLPEIVFNNVPMEKKVSIVIEGLMESHTIEVMDEQNVRLIRMETGDAKKFAKLLNLKYLPNDTYFIVVTNSLRKIIQPITLSDTGAVIDEYKSRTHYRPYIDIKESFVDISLFNGRIATVEVNIFDDNGQSIYTEIFEHVLTVGRRYQLKDLPRGDYVISVKTEEDVHTKKFEIL